VLILEELVIGRLLEAPQRQLEQEQLLGLTLAIKPMLQPLLELRRFLLELAKLQQLLAMPLQLGQQPQRRQLITQLAPVPMLEPPFRVLFDHPHLIRTINRC
jgi:hypothetical protein